MNEERVPESTEHPLSAAEMLAVTETQQQRTEAELSGRPGALFGAWGLAWLFGFGALFATIGRDPIVEIAWPFALLFFFACLGSAGVVTGKLLRHASRGLRGPAQTGGAMYGWSWTLGFLALSGVIAAVARTGISYEVYALLWSAGSGLVVGILFLCGGAMMCDRWQYGIGLWVLAVNAAGGFAGIPGHYLVMSLAGGGGFLAAALVLSRRPKLWTPAVRS